ncbi:MAG: hypothetical protein MI920_37680 [Kiloniellales bacterium]|nr:hypothetical protein [Kiloniellales bacterium]
MQRNQVARDAEGDDLSSSVGQDFQELDDTLREDEQVTIDLALLGQDLTAPRRDVTDQILELSPARSVENRVEREDPDRRRLPSIDQAQRH